MARIRKSRALTAHLIYAKTEQVLHLSLESGGFRWRVYVWTVRCRGDIMKY